MYLKLTDKNGHVLVLDSSQISYIEHFDSDKEAFGNKSLIKCKSSIRLKRLKDKMIRVQESVNQIYNMLEKTGEKDG